MNFLFSHIKIRSCYLWLIGFILFFDISDLRSQEQLRLDQAWSIALQNNYNLQMQEKLIEKAREEISIQRTDYYPSVSTSAVFARANFDQFPLEMPNISRKVGIDLVSLSVDQQIFSGFKTKNLVESAHNQLAASETKKILIRNTVLLEVGSLYYDIQSNLLRQSAFNASIDRIINQHSRVYNLYLSDQATPFDTLEISNRKLQIQNQLALLEDAKIILESNLRYLLNEEKLPPVEPLAPLTVDYSLNELAEYIRLASQMRPELNQLSAQKDARISYADALTARYYPQLSASVAFNYMKPTGDILKSEWTNFYSILLNLRWELWNWNRDSKKVQQARLDIQELDLQQLQLIQDIRHQVKVAWQNLQSAKKNIKLQKNLVDQEKERYRIVEERYREGLATFFDLNSAEVDLTEAEIELHKYYITWYKNKLKLDFATGIIGKSNQEVSNE